jgi:peptidyl-prolyl cis-trans isomerase C
MRMAGGSAKANGLAGLRVALIALAACGLAACGGREAPERPPEAGDVAVARVGDDTVWRSDVVREAVAQNLIGEGEPLDTSSDLFRRVLDEVVDRKLLAAEALNRRLDRDPAAQLRMDAARERILGDLLVQGVVDKAVNDDAIKTLYEEQVKLSRASEEIRARQIIVASVEDAEAVKKLLASGAAFEALALERSVDTATRFNGGDLDYFTVDVMPDAYKTALKDAKVGQVVGPFPVESGFALLKVEDRRTERPIALEEARPQIVRFLTYDEVRELLERLRAQTKVQVLVKPGAPLPGAPKEPATAAKTAAPAAPAKAPAPGPAMRPSPKTEP